MIVCLLLLNFNFLLHIINLALLTMLPFCLLTVYKYTQTWRCCNRPFPYNIQILRVLTIPWLFLISKVCLHFTAWRVEHALFCFMLATVLYGIRLNSFFDFLTFYSSVYLQLPWIQTLSLKLTRSSMI